MSHSNVSGTCRLFFNVHEEDEDGRESPTEGRGNDAFPIHERGLIRGDYRGTYLSLTVVNERWRC